MEEFKYPHVFITFKMDYYDNIDLCDCEIKRRHDEIVGFFNYNIPMKPQSSGSIVWCQDTSPWCAYTNVTQSVLDETIKYIKNNYELRNFVEITLRFYD